MIIVTGSILARAGCEEQLLAASRAHVARSRKEAGCISHAVHRDVENPRRLVFLEEWSDRASLITHFAVPGSREFVKTAGELADGAPQLKIYEANEIRMMPGTRP